MKTESALAEQCARELLAAIPGVMRFIRSHMREQRGGLTIPQFRSLVFLSLHENASLSELAEHLGLSLAGASRMVELLVRRGLIRRRAEATDRRRVCLSLTASGRQKFRTAHGATQVALARHLAESAPPDLVRLKDSAGLLARLFETNGEGKAVRRRVSRRGASV